MSTFKLIDWIERGFMDSCAMFNNTTNWMKIKKNYRNKSYKTGKQALNIIGVHERNGSRGNGIGMGHRNKPRQN